MVLCDEKICWWNVECITPSSWWWGWYGMRDMHARIKEGVSYQSLTTYRSRVACSLYPPCMLHNVKPSFGLHAMALPRGDVWRFASSRYYSVFYAKQQLLTVVFWLTLCTKPKWEPIWKPRTRRMSFSWIDQMMYRHWPLADSFIFYFDKLMYLNYSIKDMQANPLPAHHYSLLTSG